MRNYVGKYEKISEIRISLSFGQSSNLDAYKMHGKM